MFDMAVFDTTDKFPEVPIDETLGYSGLRLRAELRKARHLSRNTRCSKGASYFRGIGTRRYLRVVGARLWP